ncbi:hypothetical protein A3860_36405 [Niastella vici]|uniref:DUF6443 domain-containing protein n=1 Tax=Niastella vici TaxID=1703345 RepID=A0A1V9FMS3_9BACT|nr:DUF6443 domain-containing protein [Niastella vici]OQP59655.1 hypothetical protein A3860_36405 [Niastella vici]
MRNKMKAAALAIGLILFVQAVFAQLTIQGASCVDVGTTYSYTLMDYCSSTQNIYWCVNGGTIVGYGSCRGGNGLCTISVQWTSGNGKSIDVHNYTNNYNGNLAVTVTSTLVAGTIDNTSQTVNYNNAPATITCSAASGGGCSSSYSYQWQQSIDGSNWTDISGATSQNLGFSSGLTQTTYYRRRVINSGLTAYTGTATVSVIPPLSGGTLYPATQDIYAGSASAQLDGDAAGGGCSSYSYQWLISSNGTDFYLISGATSRAYSPGLLSETRYFRRQVTCNGTGATAFSSIATVNVHAHLSAGNINPASTYINYNTSPGQITESGESGGMCSSYSYQWQVLSGASYIDIPGATGTNYTPGSLTTTTNYQLKITCGSETVYAGPATINVYPQLMGGDISPASQNINYNTVPSTLSSVNVSGGNGTYTYQWQSSSDNSTWNNIADATASTYTPYLGTSTYYRVIVTSNGVSQPSSSAIVNVYPQLLGGSLTPAIQTAISYNGTAGQLTLSGVSGGSGTYTYIWQFSTDNMGWNTINNVTSTTYTPVNVTTSGFYRVIVNSNGVTAYSSVAAVYVVLNAGTISGNTGPFAYGGSPGQLSGTNAGGGNCISYSYQWQQSADGITYYDISGANAQNYTPVDLGYNTFFRRKVSCGSEIQYSNALAISINAELLPGAISPAILTIDANTNPGLITGNPASGGSNNGTFNYQWQKSTDGGVTWTDISGATSLNFAPGTVGVNTFYRRKVTSSSNEVAYTNISSITMRAGTVTNMNYIRVRDITKAGVANAAAATQLTDPFEIKQSTQYFDGLGRLVQTVAKQATPLLKDMVVPVGYDEFGRQVAQYLPYVSSAADGEYKPNALPEQTNFNSIQFSGEQYYYAQKNYEASPAERIISSYAAGQSWAGNNRGIFEQSFANTLADNVQMWGISLTAGSLPVSAGAYPVGQLHKLVTSDERGKQVVEYKDRGGNLILKKVQLSATPATDHTGWLCTYYVYDNLNNLRFVLQPRAVELISNNWTITQDIADDLCFRYEYDQSNRMILKKIPGAAETYMIYDIRDRVVFTQDGNMRSKDQWLATLYDGQNRQVITAMMNWTGSKDLLQQNVTTQTNGLQSGLVADLTLQDPNTSGTYQALQSITLDQGFETAGGGVFTAEIVSQSVPTIVDDMAVNNNPVPVDGTLDILTKTGYDTYTTIPSQSALTGTIDNTYTGSNYLLPSNNNFPYADGVGQSLQTRGLVTWTQTKVLGTAGQYLYSVSIYDEKGRVVQLKSNNRTGGTDITTTQYSFSAQPLVKVQKHEYVSGSNPQTHVVVNKNSYDAQGRLVSVKKTINSNINGVTISKPELEIIHNQYDELGQLNIKNIGKKKDVNGNYTSDAIQALTYDYNIRGWLLGVNREYLGIEGQTNDGILFGFELGYDKATNKAGQNFAASQYNGNITGVLWKSDGDDIRRKYDFTYDAANRLLRGDFTQQNADDHQWNNSQVNYNVMMGDGIDPTLAYDANGNILWMRQWGLTVTGSAPIDDLHYSYYKTNKSNKLSAVTDLATGGTPPTGSTGCRLGDFADKSTNGNDYGYDVNGNLVTDLNKKLIGTADENLTSGGAISYNHLNLPATIEVKTDNGLASKGTITYLYDAAGNKLQKVVVERNNTVTYNNQSYISDITTTTNYVNGFVYESRSYNNNAGLSALEYTDKLQFLGHEEGRVRYIAAGDNTAAHLEYDYFLKDHLGNIRMVLTEEQKTDVYQAGMELAKRDAEVKLFGDKINTTAADKYGDFDSDGNNQKVSLVNGTTAAGRVGPGVILKVMAGDKITAKAFAWYQPVNMDNTTDPGLAAIITNVLGQLTPGITGMAHGAVASQVTDNTLQPGMENFLGTQSPASGAPKAYLSWVLLDEEQFKMVSGGVTPVPQITAGQQKQLLQANNGNPIEMTRNGYLYVFVSNESKGNVYFDDIRVEHIHGPLVEETHYYPFGLTMAGISSKAPTTLVNRHLYAANEIQNAEFANGSGLDLYDFNARTYDPQLGRFIQVDPMADEGGQERLSPFHYSYNNPVLYTDHDGKIGIVGALIGGAIGAVASLTKSVIQGGFKALKDKKTWAKAGVNAVAGAIVGATGGLGAGLVATAGTSFGASLAEDKIDGNKLDFKKATATAIFSVAAFGAANVVAGKLTKAVTSHWWNRGNTNAFMRYLGRNPATNVGQLVDRAQDALGLGSGLGFDLLFPGQPEFQTLPGVTVTGTKVKGKVKLDEHSVEKAVGAMHQNNKKIKDEKEE